MRAAFKRKDVQIYANEFEVEKTIRLPEKEFLLFKHNLHHCYPFIKENKDLMYSDDGVFHCILVTGEGSIDGVLVESEGADYARYSAYITDATVLLRQRYRALDSMNERLEAAVDLIIQGGMLHTDGGMQFYSKETIRQQYNLSDELMEIVAEMLTERKEVMELAFAEKGLKITYRSDNGVQMQML